MSNIMGKEQYILGENTINGIELDDRIREEGLHEYYIVDREELIDNLIMWIAEAQYPMLQGRVRSADAYLMKEDLKMLMEWDDDYILSSMETNSYLNPQSDGFNEACIELISINDQYYKH